MTEVVTGWLSCEGGKIGGNNTFLVWREEGRGPGSQGVVRGPDGWAGLLEYRGPCWGSWGGSQICWRDLLAREDRARGEAFVRGADSFTTCSVECFHVKTDL